MSLRGPDSVSKMSKVSLLFNILTISFMIVYYIIPSYNILYHVFGIILVFTFFIDILMILLIDKYLVKSSTIGKKLNQLSFYYIGCFIIGVLLMLIGVILMSFLIEGELLFITLISIGVYLITGLGAILSMLFQSSINKRGVWSQ